MSVFVPVFEKEGNRLFVCLEDFVGQTEDEALKIGYGAMLVEGILAGMKFTGKVKEIDPKETPHRKCEIIGMPVAIISGPLFNQAEGE